MSVGLLTAKLALGPVLLSQARRLKRTALRLPEPDGPRVGQVGAGIPVLRVLVVGDSSAAGVGVDHQSAALALPLAHELSRLVDGAVAWQLVARTGVNSADARVLIAKTLLEPADVVVMALGVNDVSSQVSAAAFVQQLGDLWGDLQAKTGARWAVISGLPPMHILTAVPQPLRWYLGRYAAHLDLTLQQWSGSQNLGYCSLQWAADPKGLARDGFHPGPVLYPQWARRLAELIRQGRQQWAG